MASPHGNPASNLTAQLRSAIEGASFFQSVRLLELHSRWTRPDASGLSAVALGTDTRPEFESVRFRVTLGLRFPSAEISSIVWHDNSPRPELHIAFLGLTGPMGALPSHYSETLISRKRLRDTAMIDFFDLFNHRTVSLFYRAWAKYRIPVAFEAAAAPLEDTASKFLLAIIGLGSRSLRNRLSIGDSALVRHAGHLSKSVRSAIGLRQMLEEEFSLPIVIEELQGSWISIEPKDQTRLPEPLRPKGSFAQLGLSTIVGQSIWECQNRFRVRIGPLTLLQFRKFFEEMGLRKKFIDLTRFYVGPGQEFDLRLVLKRDQVPATQLGDTATGSRLGQTTWVLSGSALRDRDDPILSSRNPVRMPRSPKL
jgi:type VI secretion system protein ImpH